MARERYDRRSGEVSPRESDEFPPCVEDAAEPTVSWVIPNKGGKAQGYLAARDEDFTKRYPTLALWMTLSGRSGKERKTGSLVFFAEDGRFKACVNDKETRMVAFVSSESFLGLLEAVEKGLKGGTLDWRDARK